MEDTTEIENWYLVDGELYVVKIDPVLHKETLVRIVKIWEDYYKLQALTNREVLIVGMKILGMILHG